MFIAQNEYSSCSCLSVRKPWVIADHPDRKKHSI